MMREADFAALAAPLPQSAGSGAGGARRRGRGRRDLFSPLVQGVPTMAPRRRTPRATSPPTGRARQHARAPPRGAGRPSSGGSWGGRAPPLTPGARAGHTADAVLPDLGAAVVAAA